MYICHKKPANNFRLCVIPLFCVRGWGQGVVIVLYYWNNRDYPWCGATVVGVVVVVVVVTVVTLYVCTSDVSEQRMSVYICNMERQFVW